MGCKINLTVSFYRKLYPFILRNIWNKWNVAKEMQRNKRNANERRAIDSTEKNKWRFVLSVLSFPKLYQLSFNEMFLVHHEEDLHVSCIACESREEKAVIRLSLKDCQWKSILCGNVVSCVICLLKHRKIASLFPSITRLLVTLFLAKNKYIAFASTTRLPWCVN